MKPFTIKSRILTCLAAMLLLTASLSACASPMLSQTTVEGFTYTLYGQGRVERIEVKRGEERIGTYAQKGITFDLLTQLGDDSRGFRVTDLNFDRLPDMQLAVANTPSGMRYATYLWDETSGEYVLDRELSALHDVGMIASLSVITAREYEYTIDPATSDSPEFYTERNSYVLYRRINGALTEVHRKDMTYYEESDIYCYAVYALDENGELELIRESWIDAEKIDHSKYPLDATGFEGYAAE